MKTDIFISYRREDNYGMARAIKIGLENRGFSVFLDTSNIRPGDRFPEEIINAIKEANDFIIVVSQSYFGKNSEGTIRIIDKADWCRQEVICALNNNKHIIPIVQDKVFFKNPLKRQTGPHNLYKEITPVFDYNYLEYSKTEDIDSFIDRLQDSLSYESIFNSQRNLYKDKLKKIEEKKDSSNLNTDLKDLVLKLPEDIINSFFYPILDESEPLPLQFLAYYAIYTYYRRLGYQTRIISLVKNYGNGFNKTSFPFSFNSVINSQYCLYLFEDNPSDISELDKAIHYAEDAIKNIHSNSGVLVTYAELVAYACKINKEQYLPFVHKAIQCITHAMKMNPDYPKHYYIQGQLEGVNGNYSEGLRLIHKAIDLENSENKDSYLRIAKYYDAIHDLKLMQLKDEILDIIERKMK